MKKIVALILAGVMTVCASVCFAEGLVGGIENGTKEGSGSLSFISTEPNTLNMLQSTSNLDTDVFYLTSAMLYRPYDNTKYAELAEGYTVSDDGLTYTYTIKDAVYTDGTPVTADDFVYYIVNKYITTENCNYFVGGEAFYNGEGSEKDVGVKVVDNHTFTVQLTAQISDFDPEMEIYPLGRKFAEAQGEKLGGTPEAMQYSGPYVLKEWVYGSYLTFEKNPLYIYADSSFQIANLKLISNADNNGKYSIFTTGEADIIVSLGEELQELIPEYCHKLVTNAMHSIEINTTGFFFDGTTFAPRDEKVTAVLSNDNFRKALNYALNKEAIVSVVSPCSAATNRYISPFCPGNSDDTLFVDDYPINAAPVTGDEAKAKEYMAAALQELGYSSVDELPTIKYLTFDNTMYRLMAETIQSEWKRVLGLNCIQIDLQPIQSAIMSMVFMNYDMYYQNVTCSPSTLRENMAYWITGGGVSDAMGAGAPFSSIYSDARYDELMDMAKYEMDRTARNALLAEAEQIFIDANIDIPIMYNGIYYAVSDRVEGYVQMPNSDGYMFNFTTLK